MCEQLTLKLLLVIAMVAVVLGQGRDVNLQAQTAHPKPAAPSSCCTLGQSSCTCKIEQVQLV